MVVGGWQPMAHGQQKALTVATHAKRDQNSHCLPHNGLTQGFAPLYSVRCVAPFNAPSRLPEVVRQKARRTLQMAEYAVTWNGAELE